MKALGSSVLALVALLVIAWHGFSSTARAADRAATVAAANLSVKTVNAAGKAVGGALVNVFPAGVSTPAATGSTDASGKITFVGLPDGNYTVFASKVFVVGGLPTAIFGSANVTIAGAPVGVTVALVNFAP